MSRNVAAYLLHLLNGAHVQHLPLTALHVREEEVAHSELKAGGRQGATSGKREREASEATYLHHIHELTRRHRLDAAAAHVLLPALLRLVHHTRLVFRGHPGHHRLGGSRSSLALSDNAPVRCSVFATPISFGSVKRAGVNARRVVGRNAPACASACSRCACGSRP